MRAVGVTAFGGPEQLELNDVPEPHAGRGEVRVRVRAATVNPTDTRFRAGKGASDLPGKPPYVPGMEAAGEIDEVGVDVDWRVGDPAMCIALPRSERGGAYAEHVRVPSRSVARVPAGLSWAEAATVPMTGLTAQLALDKLALETGGTVVLTGAAGMLGGYVLQLAKSRGFVVVADSAPKDEEFVRSVGADHIVARGHEVGDRIREVVPDGVDGLVDTARLNEGATGAIKDGGGLAVVRGRQGEPGRGIDVNEIWVQTYAERADVLDRLREYVEAGVLTPRVAQVYPAEHAADAHRRIEAGGTRGRLLLEF